MRVIIIGLILISAIGCLGLAGIGGAGWYQAFSTRAELRRTEAELAQLGGRIEDLESEAAQARRRWEEAEQLLDCGFDPVEIDYSGNAQVSDSLQAFISETYGEVVSADWEEFWIDSEDALHSMMDGNDFSYDFFVYFVDPGTESFNGVFYLSWGCWLDLPQ
jgi:hypothetical protein